MAERLEDFSLSKTMLNKGALQKVGIIGCGSMGQEIAKNISQHGFDVIFIDVDEKRVAESYNGIVQLLDDEIMRWGMTQGEKRLILSRIKGTVDYQQLSDCDIVLETINSKRAGTSIEMRKEIFRKIEKVVRRDTVIASNTAVLMISDLASGLEYPDRAVGLHFLSPADRVKILEVVRSAKTSDESYELVCKFVTMLEKKVVKLLESPGNISTRMIVVEINQACEILMEGIASVEDIDETMKESLGHQYGPFELADRVGLDKIMKWMDGLYNEFGGSIFKTSPVIKRLVRTNYLGKASGVGFYKYDANGKIIGHTITCPEIKL
jgi:3-hydroxybutyryl-CoA dehydrogenase